MSEETSVYRVQSGEPAAKADSSKQQKTPVMYVVDDRDVTIGRRRRHRLISSFQSQDFENVYQFQNKLYKKAKKRNLWSNPDLGPQSVKMTCPNCRNVVDTIVVFQHTWKSIMTIICCTAVGLCCIPVVLRSWQDGLHYCPLCDVYLGHSQRRHTWRHNPPKWLQCHRP